MKPVKFDGRKQVLLFSRSRLFLEGISGIIKSKSEDVAVTVESIDQKIRKRLVKIKPQFLFLDNRTFNMDINNLLNLVYKKSPNTKVILFKHKKHQRINPDSCGVIYITKETKSSELVKIIKNNRLGNTKRTLNNFRTDGNF